MITGRVLRQRGAPGRLARWHIHRSCAIAVFDDRIEIRSLGSLPRGVTADALSGIHPSVLRNPLIAEAFHRTGAVEIWGRGTNRVIEECERYGVEPPTFEEHAGVVYVTFRAAIGPGGEGEEGAESGAKSGPRRGRVTGEVLSLLKAAGEPRTRGELQRVVGLSDREHFRKAYIEPLVDAGLLEPTIPEKPRSSRQRYRRTPQAETLIAEDSE